MPKTADVPPQLAATFDLAEDYIRRRFENLDHRPEKGELRVDGDRYLFVRAESLYIGLCDGFVQRFGEEVAFELIYTMAWEIGSSDCDTITSRMGASDPMQRIAAGPTFFAFNGWARVELLGDSDPSVPFLHYRHPNTFESETLDKRGDVRIDGPACFFSAGYSAGWVSRALGTELQAKEIACRSQGAHSCEFVMGESSRLDELEALVRADHP